MEKIEISIDRLITSGGPLRRDTFSLLSGFEPWRTVEVQDGAYLISVRRADSDSDREVSSPSSPLSEIGDEMGADTATVAKRLVLDALSESSKVIPRDEWSNTCAACWTAMERLTITNGPGHCLQCKCCIEESSDASTSV